MSASRVGESHPRVSVVVPVFNALPHLPLAVDSVVEAGQRFGHVEIILVDNGSTDGSLELLRSRYDEVAMILRLQDGNVGAVRNHGAARARGQYLSFVDSDCVVPSDYFHHAVAIVSSLDVAATGSVYELPPEPHWIENTWFTLHRRSREGSVRYLPAGNFFCDRSAFEAVGGFDEELESGEDAELCQRLRAAGFQIYESQRVSAVHLGNPKSLSRFFRKQLWHAGGMLATFSHDWKDVPLIATMAHIASTLAGLTLFLVLGPSFTTFLAILVPLTLVVPMLAVGYRIVTVRGRANPAKAVALYWLYFAARAVALARLAFGSLGRSAATSPG